MDIYGMTGEKLGTIGNDAQSTWSQNKSKNDNHNHNDNDNDNHEALPLWQREFLSKPSISIRKGIAWRYEEPYEDTDTIVLTARSARFVDIRLPKNDNNNNNNNNNNKNVGGAALAEHPAFWAFTGTSSTVFPGTEANPMVHVAHGRWKHDISSKTYNSGSGSGSGSRPGSATADDEGDMFALENGDVAEVGIMMNPKTGRQEMYKEYWTSVDSNTPVSLTPCVVAEVVVNQEQNDTTTTTTNTGGLAIQIGNHFQAIFSRSSSSSSANHLPPIFCVERWTRTTTASSGASETTGQEPKVGHYHWVRDPRSGNVNVSPSASASSQQDDGGSVERMLCPWLTQPDREEGDEFGTTGTYKWKVTEVLRQP